MTRLGQFELLVPLGSGGSANVFLARDSSSGANGRCVALKVLHKQLTIRRDSLAMFFAEARIASRLNHPNIVKIYGLGRAENVYCLSQEYVFGENLAQVLVDSGKKNRPLTVGVILKVIAHVAGALDSAHKLRSEHGEPLALVHRDISGHNVMLSFDGVPKLMDFGIAKATDRGFETQVGIVKGKFPYMSPEQTLGKKLDHRSDIFSLGILMWEALTGEILFSGHSPGTIMKAIREKPILPPSQVAPELSGLLDGIVMRALRRAPDRRYQEAGEIECLINGVIESAGLKIDQATVADELLGIYGGIIEQKSSALQKATAGDVDLAELEFLFGGQSIKDCVTPVLDSEIKELDMLCWAPEADRRVSVPRLATVAARVSPEVNRAFQEVFESTDSTPAVLEPVMTSVEEQLVLEHLEPAAPETIAQSELFEHWSNTDFALPVPLDANAFKEQSESATKPDAFTIASAARPRTEDGSDVLLPPSRRQDFRHRRPQTPATLFDHDRLSSKQIDERAASIQSPKSPKMNASTLGQSSSPNSAYFIVFCIGLFVVGVLLSILIAG